jgi:hypothetical protein
VERCLSFEGARGRTCGVRSPTVDVHGEILMSLTKIGGLPAHVLFVHVVVVMVPLTALAAVVCAIRPQYARRLGLVLPLMGLVTLVMVPVTTHAGSWLEARVGSDPLVRKHTDLGDTLLPWAVGLFLMTGAVWWLGRRSEAGAGATGGAVAMGGRGATATAEEAADTDTAPAAPRPVGVPWWKAPAALQITAVVLAVGVSIGAVVDVYRIGESGAKAAWHDAYSQSPNGGQGG